MNIYLFLLFSCDLYLSCFLSSSLSPSLLRCAQPPREKVDMEHRKAPTTNTSTIDSTSSNNNWHHHHHHHHHHYQQHSSDRGKSRRAGKRQQYPLKDQHLPPIFIINPNRYQPEKIHQREQQSIVMKHPLAWTKKWTKWFSSCGSDRVSHTESTSSIVTIKVGEQRRPLLLTSRTCWPPPVIDGRARLLSSC